MGYDQWSRNAQGGAGQPSGAAVLGVVRWEVPLGRGSRILTPLLGSEVNGAQKPLLIYSGQSAITDINPSPPL